MKKKKAPEGLEDIQLDVSEGCFETEHLLSTLSSQCVKKARNEGFSKTDVLSYETGLANEIDGIKKSLEEFLYGLAEFPVASAVIHWLRTLFSSQSHDTIKRFEHINRLVEAGAFPVLDSDSDVLTLGRFRHYEADKIFSAVRSSSEWSFEEANRYVGTLVYFWNFLNRETFGYIKKAHDPDRLIGQKHSKVSYDDFVRLVGACALRERALVKVLYLGMPSQYLVTLGLCIEDVDFDRRVIEIKDWGKSNNVSQCDASGAVTVDLTGRGRAPSVINSERLIGLPQHVFDDLKQLCERRRKGYVFRGKHGDKIVSSVVYRNLTKAAEEAGLPSDFAPIHLIG